MTRSAVITFWESLTTCQTVTFIKNSSDELPWLPSDLSAPDDGCREVYNNLPTIQANYCTSICVLSSCSIPGSKGKTQPWCWLLKTYNRIGVTHTTYLTQESCWEKNREKWLHGLDCVREGDCDFTKTHVREQVAQCMNTCQWQNWC